MSLPIDSEWRLLSLSLIVSLFKWDRPIFKRPSRNHTLSNLFSWAYGSKRDKFLSENCNWKLSTETFLCFSFHLYLLTPSKALYIMMSLQEIVQKLWISKKDTASNVSHPCFVSLDNRQLCCPVINYAECHAIPLKKSPPAAKDELNLQIQTKAQ